MPVATFRKAYDHLMINLWYPNSELYLKKKKKIEEQDKKISSGDWITKKGGLDSMNFPWAILGAAVYKI